MKFRVVILSFEVFRVELTRDNATADLAELIADLSGDPEAEEKVIRGGETHNFERFPENFDAEDFGFHL